MKARHLHSAPMAPRPQLRLLTATFAALFAIALGACGSSDPENGLTQEQSDDLVSALENLDADQGSGDCDGASDKLDSIRDDIAAIAEEGKTDEEIVAGLEELADRTESLLAEDCKQQTETTTEDTTSSTTTTAVPTTTEEMTTEEETTTEEEEPEETAPEEEPPEEEPEQEPPGNSDGAFEPGGTGGLPPGQEKKKQKADRPNKTKSGKPSEGKARMGGAGSPTDEERKSR